MKSVVVLKDTLRGTAMALLVCAGFDGGVARAQTVQTVSAQIAYISIASTGAVYAALGASAQYCHAPAAGLVTIPASAPALNSWLSVLLARSLVSGQVGITFTQNADGSCTVTGMSAFGN